MKVKQLVASTKPGNPIIKVVERGRATYYGSTVTQTDAEVGMIVGSLFKATYQDNIREMRRKIDNHLKDYCRVPHYRDRDISEIMSVIKSSKGKLPFEVARNIYNFIEKRKDGNKEEDS